MTDFLAGLTQQLNERRLNKSSYSSDGEEEESSTFALSTNEKEEEEEEEDDQQTVVPPKEEKEVGASLWKGNENLEELRAVRPDDLKNNSTEHHKRIKNLIADFESLKQNVFKIERATEENSYIIAEAYIISKIKTVITRYSPNINFIFNFAGHVRQSDSLRFFSIDIGNFLLASVTENIGVSSLGGQGEPKLSSDADWLEANRQAKFYQLEPQRIDKFFQDLADRLKYTKYLLEDKRRGLYKAPKQGEKEGDDDYLNRIKLHSPLYIPPTAADPTVKETNIGWLLDEQEGRVREVELRVKQEKELHRRGGTKKSRQQQYEEREQEKNWEEELREVKARRDLLQAQFDFIMTVGKEELKERRELNKSVAGVDYRPRIQLTALYSLLIADIEDPVQNAYSIIEPPVLAARSLTLNFINSVLQGQGRKMQLGELLGLFLMEVHPQKELFDSFCQLSAAYYTKENDVQHVRGTTHFHYSRIDNFFKDSRQRMRRALQEAGWPVGMDSYEDAWMQQSRGGFQDILNYDSKKFLTPGDLQAQSVVIFGLEREGLERKRGRRN